MFAILAGGHLACSGDFEKVQGPEPRTFNTRASNKPAAESGDGVSLDIMGTPDYDVTGSAPGRIYLLGEIAKHAQQVPMTGSKVRYLAQMGIGKSGNRRPLSDFAKPFLKADADPGIFKPSEGPFARKLVAVGCDGRDLKAYSSETPTPLTELGDLVNEDFKIVEAETVVICGLNPITAKNGVFFNAKEVVLVETGFEVESILDLGITTQKLTLIGHNTWHTKPPKSMRGSRTSNMHLIVAKELDGAKGDVTLLADGKDYESEENP